MKRAMSGAAAAVTVLMLAVTATAVADPIQVTIDKRKVDLKEADDGWTASVGLTNLTDREIAFEVPPLDGAGNCDPTLDNEGKLPDSEHVTFNVTIPSTCDVDDEKGIEFSLEGTTSDTEAAASFAVTAGPKPEGNPDWDALKAFPVAFVILAIVAAIVLLVRKMDNMRQPLQHLGATWSFKDSWVASITVAGGILTGIFGSSGVVEAILGEDAKSAVALATVGAAIAVAFIAAGPLILEITKVRVKAEDGKRSREAFFSVGGLILASVFTLTGAAGEIWVVYSSGTELDLGGFEDEYLAVIAIIAGLLLLGYAVASLPRMIRLGLTEAPPTKSEVIEAAETIAKELRKADVEVPTATVEVAVEEAVAAGVPAVAAPSPQAAPPAAML